MRQGRFGDGLRSVDRWLEGRSVRYRRWRPLLRARLGLDEHQAERTRLRRPGQREGLQFSVVTPVYRPDRRLLVEAVASVRGQVDPRWELILVDDGSDQPGLSELLATLELGDPRVRVVVRSRRGGTAAASNTGIERARAPFVVFLDQDDVLAADALLEVGQAVEAHPDVDLVYSDDDKLTLAGERYAPQYKPDWSPDLLLAFCYLGHLKVFRRSVLRELGGMREGFRGAADYDLCLRVAERTDRVHHVRRVLYHWRAAPGSTAAAGSEKPESFASGRRALEEALQRRGLAGRVARPEFAKDLDLGLFEVRLELSDPPAVTTIRVDEHSADLSERVNREVRQAGSELVLLLANEVEPPNAAALHDLMVHAVRPGVGAVAGKLLGTGGRVLHAGGVCQGATVAPAFAGLKHERDRGPLCLAECLRNVSVLSAACLLTNRTDFDGVGGFSRDLSGPLAAADYCLRLRRHGKRILINSAVVLVHRGALARPRAQEAGRFSESWGRLGWDPYTRAS